MIVSGLKLLMNRKELQMDTTYYFSLRLYYLEDRAPENNPFLLFSHLLKMKPDDVIKAEQQGPIVSSELFAS